MMEKKQLKTYWISALALIEFILLKVIYSFLMREKSLLRNLEVEDLIVLFIELGIFAFIVYLINHWKKTKNTDISNIYLLQLGILVIAYILMDVLGFLILSHGEKYLYIFYRSIPLDQIVYMVALLTPYMIFLLGDLCEKKEITDKQLYKINLLCIGSFIFLPLFTNTWKAQLIWLIVYNVSWMFFVKKQYIYTVIFSIIVIGVGEFSLYFDGHVDNDIISILTGVGRDFSMDPVFNMTVPLKALLTVISIVFIVTQIYILLDIDFKSQKQRKLLFILFYYIGFLFLLETVRNLGYLEIHFYQFSLFTGNSGMFLYILWLIYYFRNSKKNENLY